MRFETADSFLCLPSRTLLSGIPFFFTSTLSTRETGCLKERKRESYGREGVEVGAVVVGCAVVKLASDHLLSGILCRGHSSGASAWLRHWLRKGEMKTTVNF